MKQKHLFLNMVIMVLLNLLVKPFYVLGIDSQMINIVGEQDYGYYLTLMMWGSMFMILADLGVNQFATTELASAPRMIKKYFFKLLNVKVLLMVFYTIFMLLLYTVLDLWQDPIIIWSIVFNQICIGLILYIRSLLGARLKFKSDAIVSISDKFFLILIMSYFIYFSSDEMSIKTFIWAQSIAYLLTLILSITLLQRHLKIHWKFLKRDELRHILKKSTPFALLILLMGIYQKLDVVMIERLMDQGRFWSGEYAKVYRLFEAIINFPYLLSLLLLPVFSKSIFRKSSLKPTIQLAGNMMFIGVALLMTFGVYGAHFYFDSMFKQNTTDLIIVWYLFIPSIITMCYTFIYGTLLTSGRQMKILNGVALFGVLINLTLNLSLIPIYGIIGAALATLITQFTTLLIQIYFSQRIYLNTQDLKHFTPLFLFAILFFSIYYFTQTSIIWGITLNIFAIALITILFKLISIQKIKSLILKK